MQVLLLKRSASFYSQLLQSCEDVKYKFPFTSVGPRVSGRNCFCFSAEHQDVAWQIASRMLLEIRTVNHKQAQKISPKCYCISKDKIPLWSCNLLGSQLQIHHVDLILCCLLDLPGHLTDECLYRLLKMWHHMWVFLTERDHLCFICIK